jgi:hypothetical protein
MGTKRAPGPALRLSDALPVHANVRIRAIDRDGKVVGERLGHNVLTDIGRNWITRTLVAAAFPGDAAAGVNLADNDGGTDMYSVTGATFRARYVGVGIGGTLQSISPPGPGGQTEHAGVTGLERQVKVTTADWLKQLEPNDTLSDPLQFPDDYTVRLRAIFAYDDISFPDQPLYGTNVPVTEVALYTSQAALAVAGGNGCIAYHQFSPFSKTPAFALELIWELRA